VNETQQAARMPSDSGSADAGAGTPERAAVQGIEHWTTKNGVRLFLWEKFVGTPEGKPVVLFVHGSSMASQPTFDLHVPGRPDSSVMDWFARRGFACVTVDMEGYGRSDKSRDIPCDIANGADAQRPVLSEYHAIGSSGGAFMLRHGRYKYCRYVHAPPQLFDLESDPGEMRNLTGDPAHREVLKIHREMLQMWKRRTERSEGTKDV